MKIVVPDLFSIEIEEITGFEWPKKPFPNCAMEFKIFLKGGKDITVKAKSMNNEDSETLQEKFTKFHNAWVGVEDVITP
jgi:hypothetical protein